MINVPWNIHPGIIAGTTGRNGGFSEPPFDSLNMALYLNDDTQNVLKNRGLIADFIRVPLTRWVFPKLTHSDRWIKVSEEDAGRGAMDESTSPWGADAVYTGSSHLVLAVGHADCLPILLYCPTRHLIGAIHTGWQGTVKQITDKFLYHWITEEHCDPKDIYIYIGPSICKHNFIVRQDVIDAAALMDFDVQPFLTPIDDEHTSMDLQGINMAMMLRHHIPMENITDTKLCTYDHPDQFFSYRRNKITGRQISFIVQK